MRIHSPNSWSRNTVTANARWIMFKIKYMILPAGSQVGCHLDSGSSGCHAGQLLPLLVWKCIPPESTSRSQGFTAALIYSILMKTVWWNVELDKIIAPSPLSTSLRALSNVVFELLALLAGPKTHATCPVDRMDRLLSEQTVVHGCAAIKTSRRGQQRMRSSALYSKENNCGTAWSLLLKILVSDQRFREKDKCSGYKVL